MRIMTAGTGQLATLPTWIFLAGEGMLAHRVSGHNPLHTYMTAHTDVINLTRQLEPEVAGMGTVTS